MKNRQWLLAAAVVLALGGAVYALLRLTEQGPEAPATRGPERAEQARDIIADLQKSGAAPSAQALDRVYEQAQAFQKQGQLADAQLLYFYAARAGHAPSAFALATTNDPLHHSDTASLLPEPDPFQAYRWYSVAREHGMAGADQRLEALHEWAQRAADDGNLQAQQLLLQWE